VLERLVNFLLQRLLPLVRLNSDLARGQIGLDQPAQVEQSLAPALLKVILQGQREAAQDFGARPFGLGDKRPLLEFIAAYLPDEGYGEYVLQGKPTVRFQPYAWSLNN